MSSLTSLSLPYQTRRLLQWQLPTCRAVSNIGLVKFFVRLSGHANVTSHVPAHAWNVTVTSGRLGYLKLATGVLRHKHNPRGSHASVSTIEERSTLMDIRRFLHRRSKHQPGGNGQFHINGLYPLEARNYCKLARRRMNSLNSKKHWRLCLESTLDISDWKIEHDMNSFTTQQLSLSSGICVSFCSVGRVFKLSMHYSRYTRLLAIDSRRSSTPENTALMLPDSTNPRITLSQHPQRLRSQLGGRFECCVFVEVVCGDPVVRFGTHK